MKVRKKSSLPIVEIATLQTVKRGGEIFVVNPYTRELRPLDPPKNAYLEVSPALENLLLLRREKS